MERKGYPLYFFIHRTYGDGMAFIDFNDETIPIGKRKVAYVKYAMRNGTSEIAARRQANKKFGCKYAPQWLIKDKQYKVDKATFRLPLDGDIKKVDDVKSTVDNVEMDGWMVKPTNFDPSKKYPLVFYV